MRTVRKQRKLISKGDYELNEFQGNEFCGLKGYRKAHNWGLEEGLWEGAGRVKDTPGEKTRDGANQHPESGFGKWWGGVELELRNLEIGDWWAHKWVSASKATAYLWDKIVSTKA